MQDVQPRCCDDGGADQREGIRHVAEERVSEKDHPDHLGVDKGGEHGRVRNPVRHHQAVVPHGAEDPHQDHNIAADHPKVVKEMSDYYENWWKEVAALLTDLENDGTHPFFTRNNK